MRGLPADSYPLPEGNGHQASAQRSPRRICAACQRNCAASTLKVEEHSSSRSPSAGTAPQCRQTRSDIAGILKPLRSRKAARSTTLRDESERFSTIGSSCQARRQRNRALASFHFARSFSEKPVPTFRGSCSSVAHDPFPKTGTHFSGIVPLPLRTILSRKPVPTFRGSRVETLAEKFRRNVQPNAQILGVEFAPAQVRDGVMRSFTKCGPQRPRLHRGLLNDAEGPVSASPFPAIALPAGGEGSERV